MPSRVQLHFSLFVCCLFPLFVCLGICRGKLVFILHLPSPPACSRDVFGAVFTRRVCDGPSTRVSAFRRASRREET